MKWPSTYSFLFLLVLAASIMLACGNSSNPMRSTESAQSTRATQLSQSSGAPQQSTANVAGRTTATISEDQPGLGNPGNSGTFSSSFDPGNSVPAARSVGVTPITAGKPETNVEPKQSGQNRPPVFNNNLIARDQILLFPRGPATVLEFDGEPATDPDGDELTYRFGFLVPGNSEVQTAGEALLKITRVGNRFLIEPDGVVSPAEFAAVYGNTATIPTMVSGIFASDGTLESAPQGFALSVFYDASAQFSAPAQYVGDQRWVNPEPVDWYEGATEPVGGNFPTWTAITGDSKDWELARAASLIRCEIGGQFEFYTPPDGGADNDLFLLESESTSRTGTVSLAFKTAPDFDQPRDSDGDNVYRLRVVNTNNVHNLSGEGRPTGCSGTILDVDIRVRRVGVPSPPGIISASISGTPETGETVIKVYWIVPVGFRDYGRLMPLPPGFEVTDYDYRYRVTGTSIWTEETDSRVSQDPIKIEGLMRTSYEVQVRANNRNGPGEWSNIVEVRWYRHNVSFAASQYSTLAGNKDRVRITVHMDPPPLFTSVTVPLAVIEENGFGLEDYSGVPESLTFGYRETRKTFTVESHADSDRNEGRDAFIRLGFVDLPSNVTAVSPASTKVILGN